MNEDRSARTPFAAALFLAAVLVAANRAVQRAPLLDWWLPLLLTGGGLLVYFFDRFRLGQPIEFDEQPASPSMNGLRTGREFVPEALPSPAASVSVAQIPAPPPVAPPQSPAEGDVPPADAPERPPQPESSQMETPAQADDTPEPPFLQRNEYARPEDIISSEPNPKPPAESELPATEKTSPADVEVPEATAAAPEARVENPEAAPSAADVAERATPAETPDTPVVYQPSEDTIDAVPAPAPGKPDDLEVLDGIGPKLAELLRSHGIDTFEKLSQTTADKLREIVDTSGLRVIGSVHQSIESWPEQAAYAARGDWDGLNRINAERKAHGDDDTNG